MSFVRTILGDVPTDGLRRCGAHEHVIIDAPHIAEKHPDFLLDDIDAACVDLREFRDAGGGWVIDTMPIRRGSLCAENLPLPRSEAACTLSARLACTCRYTTRPITRCCRWTRRSWPTCS